MHNLFDSWRNLTPNYDAKFSEIFNNLAKKAGGVESGEKRSKQGKSFETNYELYIYAFFLGLYSGEKLPIPETSKKINFGYQIHKWGSKSSLKRKSFTDIQKYIFSALIAESEIDFIALDKGEITPDQAIHFLNISMEEFTNYGLTLINDKLNESPLSFTNTTSFLDFISSIK